MDKIHLQTVDQCSTIFQKRERVVNQWDKNKQWSLADTLYDKHWGVEPSSNIHLTSSLFVLHEDLQLQQPPRNIRIISHHSQCSLKLSLHTKLYTAISYINVQK